MTLELRRVLIADDHAVTRRGLREILVDAFGDLEIVEVGDADGALAAVAERTFDLMLLDVLMPGSKVLDTLTRVRAKAPTTPTLMLTAATEIEYVVQCLNAGANGFIHKHRASEDLLDAIRKVASGGSYLHPETAADIAAGLRAPRPDGPHDRLSTREREIFLLLARGRSIKEIAADRGLSDKTVATYLARIREKTGLTSYVDIARYALQHGLVD